MIVTNDLQMGINEEDMMEKYSSKKVWTLTPDNFWTLSGVESEQLKWKNVLIKGPN